MCLCTPAQPILSKAIKMWLECTFSLNSRGSTKVLCYHFRLQLLYINCHSLVSVFQKESNNCQAVSQPGRIPSCPSLGWHVGLNLHFLAAQWSCKYKFNWVRETAKTWGLAQSAVWHTLKAKESTGKLSIVKRPGRARKTTNTDDRKKKPSQHWEK